LAACSPAKTAAPAADTAATAPAVPVAPPEVVPPAPADKPFVPTDAQPVPAPKQSRTTYKCDNDETIEVRFFPDQGVAVLVRGGQNTELHPETVADGFKYSNGAQTSIRGVGDTLTLQVGMMAAAKCTAVKP
uniref:MliC family protein n=1 Tax=Sphingomonas sp. TaxID=28214 RepID=UPI003CC6C8B2